MPAHIAITLNAALVAKVNARQDTSASLHSALGAGLTFQTDGVITGTHKSPAGRLIELQTTVEKPGHWSVLRVTLPDCDLTQTLGLGFWMRSAAASPTLSRACLRIGNQDGHDDHFFDQHILSAPAQGDHHALMMFDKTPMLSAPAPWREFLLFLPPTQNLALSIIDLRLFTVGDRA